MENTISFTFSDGEGHMTIALDDFFPIDEPRLRKLLKLIDEDRGKRDKLLAAIIQHCTRCAAFYLNLRANWANQSVTSRARAEALQPEIEKLTGKIKLLKGQTYREARKEWKAQLRDMKKKQRDALSNYRFCRRRAANAKKQAERLTKNAEVAYESGTNQAANEKLSHSKEERQWSKKAE